MSYKKRLQTNNAGLGLILDAVNDLPDAPASRDSPLPIGVETEEEMTAILKNATSESVGAVYKYVGNYSETYKYGNLYVIAEE